MNQPVASVRNVRIFRYDPAKGEDGHFDSYALNIPDENATTILDVLLRIQREQDPTLAFRYACRVNMCGSCGLVINGKEGLACKTNVSHIPAGKDITVRPLNHFPVVKDLVVDMAPFFARYEESLPFFVPREELDEPVKIRPDARERQDIGMSTDCIACGCCVSSCTMCRYHEGYTGPAALNRAFTLLADVRDGMFDERLNRALASCYNCRTEFNCTEVCPKGISGTRAIKYIQRLALKHIKAPAAPCAAAAGASASACAAASPCACDPASAQAPLSALDRRAFLRQVGVGVVGGGAVLVLGGLLTGAAVAPTLKVNGTSWLRLGPLADIPEGAITTVTLNREVKHAFYSQNVTTPVLISRVGGEIVCFKAACPHLGCIVKWDALSDRFKCACHGGTFARDGKVLAGPPPRPLDRYAFKVDAGQLLVEVS